MKKINLLIIAVLVSAVGFMTSCGDETITPAPTATFTDGDQTVMPNTDLEIAYTVTAAGEIDEISFKKDGANFGTPLTKDFDSDTTHAASIIIAAADVTETFTLSVEVLDKKGASKEVTVTITVEVPGPVVKTTESVKIYCATGDQTGYGDYASLTTFETWSHNQAEDDADIIANIDVCYYNGNYTKDLGGHPHLVSPDACPSIIHSDVILTDAKSTKFLVLTDATAFADFSTIEDDVAIKAIDMSNAVANVGDFEQDAVIAFELANGKMGVMKAVGGTAGYGNTDYILVDVIVQKNAPVK